MNYEHELGLIPKSEAIKLGLYKEIPYHEIFVEDDLTEEEVMEILKVENELSEMFLNRYETSRLDKFIYFNNLTLSGRRYGLYYDYEMIMLRYCKKHVIGKNEYEITLGQIGGERLRFEAYLRQYAKDHNWKHTGKPKQIRNEDTGKYETKEYIDKIYIERKGI